MKNYKKHGYTVVRASNGMPIDPHRIWTTKRGIKRFLERRRSYGDGDLRAVRLFYISPHKEK